MKKRIFKENETMQAGEVQTSIDPTKNKKSIDDLYKDLDTVTDEDIQPYATIIHELVSQINKSNLVPLLIAGSTGIGKTTLLRDTARMLGLGLVVLEAPTVVQVHVLNLPFVITTPAGEKKKGVETITLDDPNSTTASKGEDPKYSVVYGKSYLMTMLEKSTDLKISDSELTQHLQSLPKHLQGILKEIQTNSRYKGILVNYKKVRSHFSSILFIDEFLRKSDPVITNVMRNIITNRKIGPNYLPSSVGIILASNVKDSGVNMGLTTHEKYRMDTPPAPTLKRWLRYLTSSTAGTASEINKDVLTVVYNTLSDEDVSKESDDLRTSPRRWTEIVLLINDLYPFDKKNQTLIDRARHTIKEQLSNEEGQVLTDISEKIDKIFNTLMSMSNLNIEWTQKINKTDWKTTLLLHLASLQKNAGMKKYVPVVRGLPGIGKTSIINTLTDPPLNLAVITVDCTNIDPESIVGVSIPKDPNTDPTVEFTAPPLLQEIMDNRKTADEKFTERLSSLVKSGEITADEAKTRQSNRRKQKYQYLVFFDEFNRVNELDTFNSLRRLILEKEFNEAYSLPDDMLVVAAMNPAGGQGIHKLTHHMRDAIDIIDAVPSWTVLTDYFNNTLIPSLVEEYIDKDSLPYGYTVKDIEKFANDFIQTLNSTFTLKRADEELSAFIIEASGANFYFDPRGYTAILKTFLSQITDGLYRYNDELEKSNENKAADVLIAFLKRQIKSAFAQSLTQGDFYEDALDDGVDAMIEQFVMENVIRFKTNINIVDILESYAESGMKGIDDDPEIDEWLDEAAKSPQESMVQFMNSLTDIYPGNSTNERDLYNRAKRVHAILTAFYIVIKKTNSQGEYGSVSTNLIELMEPVRNASGKNSPFFKELMDKWNDVSKNVFLPDIDMSLHSATTVYPDSQLNGLNMRSIAIDAEMRKNDLFVAKNDGDN